jgi:hypothetical protein
MAKDLPLPGILDGLLDYVFQEAYVFCTGEKAFLLELLHLIDESPVFFADAITLGYTHFVEEDLRRIGGVHAEFLERALTFDAGSGERDNNERLVPMRAVLVVGIAQHAHPIRLHAVCDILLVAGDDVVAAVLAGDCPNARHV